MKTFIIQTWNVNGQYIPAQSYGYSAIETVNYTNWFQKEKIYDYGFDINKGKHSSIRASDGFEYTRSTYLSHCGKKNIVPIGSIEFVLEWLKLIGIEDIKPLNIPQELWKFCKRKVMITELSKIDGWYMVKDIDKIKSNLNNKIYLRIGDIGNDKNYFVTEWIENVVSEWRVFVFDKKVIGVRCYLGNEWIMPDKNYIDSIIRAYGKNSDKRSYTLDVMVYQDVDDMVYNGKLSYITDIVELHDFFACGLYGFEDYVALPRMWIATINEILKRKDANV